MEFSEHKCKICKKYYKSYQSLWNHIKRMHKSEDNHKHNHSDYHSNQKDNHSDNNKLQKIS